MGPGSRDRAAVHRGQGPNRGDLGPSSRDMGPNSREKARVHLFKGPSSRDMGPSIHDTDSSTFDMGPSSRGSTASSRAAPSLQRGLKRGHSTSHSPMPRARGQQTQLAIPRSPQARPGAESRTATMTGPDSSGARTAARTSKASDAKSVGPRTPGGKSAGPSSFDNLKSPAGRRHTPPRSPRQLHSSPAAARPRGSATTNNSAGTNNSRPAAAKRSGGWAAAGRSARDTLWGKVVARKPAAEENSGTAARGKQQRGAVEPSVGPSAPAPADAKGHTGRRGVPRGPAAQSPEQPRPAGASRTPVSGSPRAPKKPPHAVLQRQGPQEDPPSHLPRAPHTAHHASSAVAPGAKARGRSEQAWETVAGLCGVESVPYQCNPAVSGSGLLEGGQGFEGPVEGPVEREAVEVGSDVSIDNVPVVVDVNGSGSSRLGCSSRLGGSSRLGDMEGHSSLAGTSTWRLSEAMLGPGVLPWLPQAKQSRLLCLHRAAVILTERLACGALCTEPCVCVCLQGAQRLLCFYSPWRMW